MEYIFIPIPTGVSHNFYHGKDLMTRNSDGVTGEVYCLQEGATVTPILALMNFDNYSEIVFPPKTGEVVFELPE